MDTSVGHDSGAVQLYAGESPATERRKVALGMVMYIVTDMGTALVFFIGYVWLRTYNTNNRWFPAGVHPPDLYTSLWLTVALLVSSGAFALAQVTVRWGDQLVFRIALVIAFVIMLGTLIATFVEMGHLPFTQSDGSFASSFLLLLGYHIFHLAVAVLVGIGILIRAFRGIYTRENHVGVDIAGVWWHWVVSYALLFWLLILMQPPSLNYHF